MSCHVQTKCSPAALIIIFLLTFLRLICRTRAVNSEQLVACMRKTLNLPFAVQTIDRCFACTDYGARLHVVCASTA